MATKSAAARVERYSPDPDHALTLPSHYYFDKDIYARELEEVWFKTWQYIGFTSELKEPGDYISTFIVDQPVFVVRNKDGNLRAFYNVCMHRGHILVEGKGNTRMVTCPFHAWTYDLEGNLKAAGNAENVAGFRHEDFCLPQIQVGVTAGMVFVNLDEAAAPLEEYLAGFEADVRAKVPRFDELKVARRDDYVMDFNWKFVMDQNECYHCPHLHPGVMSGDDAYLEPSFDITMYDHWDSVVVSAEGDVESPYGAGKDDEVRDVYIWTVFPNLIISTHQGPSNFKVQRVWPTGAETAAGTMDNLCINDPPTEMDIKQFNYFRDRVWAEDSPAMTKQQLGMKSLGYTQGRLMVDPERSWKSEHAVHHFDKQVWEALNGPNY